MREESGIGDPESRVGKRFKVMGILRDVLRQKSIGVIEELPERGIIKYAKPVGLIASLVPTTNPELTPPGVGMFAIKCRDAVIFSPHPRSKETTRETVAIAAGSIQPREGSLNWNQTAASSAGSSRRFSRRWLKKLV